MKSKVTVPILAACLTGSAAAQIVTPSFFTHTTTYTQTQLFGGGAWGAGGLHFDPTGQFLFITDMSTNQVMKLTIARNAGGHITGFTSRTTVMTSRTTNWLDGGLTFGQTGTMVLVGYNPTEVEQYTTQGLQTILDLRTVGFLGEAGSCEFIPPHGGRPERFMVSDWLNGGIYEVPMTLQANQTYTIGTPKLWMTTFAGPEGIALVPSGPFSNGRGMVMVNYNVGAVYLVGLDPFTGNPLTDSMGAPLRMDLVSGLDQPMDVEFDPFTGDMFVTDYGTGAATNAMAQFSGVIKGSFDGEVWTYGSGCPHNAAGDIPYLGITQSLMEAGKPVQILMKSAPKNQPVSFFVFGVGDTGNLGRLVLAPTTCAVYVNPMISVPFPTNSLGEASMSFTLPLSSLGISVFMQAWSLAPGANPLNLTVASASVCVVK